MATPPPNDQLMAASTLENGRKEDEAAVVPSFNKMMGTQMIDINVGKGNARTHFRVHKAILCAKIPYFEKMFNSGFEEGTTNQANFPEDDPVSFNLLLLWVYGNDLPKLSSIKLGNGTREPSWGTLELYVLADKLCIVDLMDEIATAHIQLNFQGNSLPTAATGIDEFMEKLPEHAPFRKYAIHTLHGMARTPSHLTKWPADELSAVMTAHPALTRGYLRLVQEHPANTSAPDPRIPPYCQFHLHDADAPCPAPASNST